MLKQIVPSTGCLQKWVINKYIKAHFFKVWNAYTPTVSSSPLGSLSVLKISNCAQYLDSSPECDIFQLLVCNRGIKEQVKVSGKTLIIAPVIVSIAAVCWLDTWQRSIDNKNLKKVVLPRLINRELQRPVGLYLLRQRKSTVEHRVWNLLHTSLNQMLKAKVLDITEKQWMWDG